MSVPPIAAHLIDVSQLHFLAPGPAKPVDLSALAASIHLIEKSPVSLRVGFDCDGVWYDFRQCYSDYLISQGYSHCTVENCDPTWDFYEGWGFTLRKFLRTFREGVDAGWIFRGSYLLPGAVEATQVLHAAGHTTHLVTDRSVGTAPGASVRATAGWIDDHGFIIDSLTISADKTVVPTDIFIEDKIANADALNKAGTTCYLINRPWNQVSGGDDRLRVDTLDEFVAHVLAMAAVA